MSESNVEYRIQGHDSGSNSDRARYYQTEEAYNRQKRRFPRSDYLHVKREVGDWVEVDE